MITGQHFIGGRWQGVPVAKHTSFNPATDQALLWCFAEADSAELQDVTELASSAFLQYRLTSRAERAAFLQAIAKEIEALGESLVHTVMAETALPQARVEGERARTCNQLRLFAKNLMQPSADIIEAAEPERVPQAKPALHLQSVALGPVVVFGASNFPLAFSVAGGDTASALAAGCPVIVKAHNAHPATAELVARAIDKAIVQCDLPKGVFALVHARKHAFSEQLIQHPAIKAVAFTGSQQLGMHFQRLIWQRAEPIPFYGELGSQNPLFALADYLQQHTDNFAQSLLASVLMGQGQFCTRPGLVFLPQTDAAKQCAETLAVLCAKQGSGSLLTPKIAQSYREQCQRLVQQPDVELLAQGEGNEQGCQVVPRIFAVSAQTFLTAAILQEEVFGPATILVRCADSTQMQMLATTLAGQLTATVYAEDEELRRERAFWQQLALKAGRLIVNQMPTGVEVCHAMQHGGPFPASTDSRYTAVGSQAIQRFVRPVCFQNMPEQLLQDK
ncbi:aldehyde dehydrogenase (NADP(+)) [Rheinheimera baltica]|uniref:Aldehyde dehydrogenase (NADP(+)) n=1 Tax=Rheinheimera baltica TaxID=67576 RepID=A0ABT9HYR2_9GAMM|nr:aldehyde dehydrogenase (NADP(+)) [Rheinheimera baltica]MDP5136265.1 aldehyde dehydrogenase (NADP(+)) [Rheinheimera baltica]